MILPQTSFADGVGGAAGMAVGRAATGPDRTVVAQPDGAPAPGRMIERRAADAPGTTDTKMITRDCDGCVTHSDSRTNGAGDTTHSATNC